MRRSSNPVLNPDSFNRERTFGLADTMTIQGTINKCFVMLGLVGLSAYWVWSRFMEAASALGQMETVTAGQAMAPVLPFLVGGGILGFVLAIVTVFKRAWSPYTAPVYAVCEGLVLGGLSAMFELSYPGIVFQAVMLTFGTLFVMLVVYRSGIIKVDRRFMLGVASATGAVALVYLLSMILGFFGVGVPFIHSNGIIGIIFSLVVVGIAAMNLVLDFYVIEEGSRNGAHKYMEWYGAFALMVTLIWLYMEILRLLSKMRRR